MMKKTIGWLALGIFCATGAKAEMSENFGYAVSNGVAVITNYTGTNAVLEIPSKLDGYSVAEIGVQAFAGNGVLMSVTIPGSVTNIRSGAFGGCSALTEFEIPDTVLGFEAGFLGGSGVTNLVIGDGVTVIPSSAFGGMSFLKGIRIGTNATTIGPGAFGGCGGLTHVELPEGLTELSSALFGGCSSLISVLIPGSVTNIRSSAFGGCGGLKEFVMPDTVLGFEPGILGGCSGLTNLVIGNGVTDIPSGAFGGLSSLRSVTFGSGVTNLGGSLFSGCPNLTELVIPDNVISIGSGLAGSLTNVVIGNGVLELPSCAFCGIGSLRSVSIGNGVTNIGGHAFAGCPNLTELVIPDSVRKIGERITHSCFSMTNIVVGNGLEDIPENAFLEMGALQSVTIGGGVTNMGRYAFYRCGLTNIVIPDGVKTLGDEVFSGCSNLIHAAIGIGVEEIRPGMFFETPNLRSVVVGAHNVAGWTFSGNNALESIELLDSVTNVHSGCVIGCPSLTNLIVGASHQTYRAEGPLLLSKDGTEMVLCLPGALAASIPEGVASFGQQAFTTCSNLTELRLPNTALQLPNMISACVGITNLVIGNGITEIPSGGLSGLRNLRSVTFGTGLTTIGSGVFGGCANLAELIIPDNVTRLGSSMMSGCYGLTNIVIGNGVTEIPSGAFQQLGALRRVTIGTAVTNIGSGAFYATGLERVVIPDNVVTLAGGSFWSCSNLTHISIGRGVEWFYAGVCSETPSLLTAVVGAHNLAEAAFNRCEGLTSVELLDSTTNVHSRAFAGCSNLTSLIVGASHPTYRAEGPLLLSKDGTRLILCGPGAATAVIPEGVVAIAEHAFGNCAKLQELRIPDSVMQDVVSIYGCSSLTNLVFGNGITMIPEYAFSGMSALRSVTIGTGVTNIGTMAFDGTGLQNVVIPDSVTSMGHSVFGHCASLTNAYVGSGVEQLESPFYDTPLRSVTIGAHNVASWCFYGCPTVSRVVLLNSTTNVNGSSFILCTNLTELVVDETHPSYRAEGPFLLSKDGMQLALCLPGVPEVDIPASVRHIGDRAFEGCALLKQVIVPVVVETIGAGCFRMCNALTNAAMGNGVTNIGSDAFAYCPVLESVTIPAGISNLSWASYFAGTPKLSTLTVGGHLQAAVSAVPAGMTIRVLPGTYGPVSASNKAIRIESTEGAEATIIDGGGVARCASLGNYGYGTNALMIGFTLQHGYTADDGGGVLAGTLVGCTIVSNTADCGGGAAYATLRECVIRDNVATGSGSGGGTYYSTLEDCQVTGNQATQGGGGTYNGVARRCIIRENHSGIYGGGSMDSRLENCVVTDNETQYGGGVHSCTLVHSVIWGNRATRMAGGAYGGELANSIAWNNRSPDKFQAPYAVARNSCLESGTNALNGGSTNIISAHPLMVDPWSGDYRLLAGSPCLDAGNNAYATNATDLAGNARIQNGTADMGALEGGVDLRGIAVIAPEEGAVSSPWQAVTAGGAATFSVVPDGLHEFVEWQIGGVRVGTEASYTWTNVVENGELEAIFVPATIWVGGPGALDSNPGTTNAPKATIQAAIDVTWEGDEVAVRPGTYRPITTENRSIVIRSTGGAATTIIDAANQTRCAQLASLNNQTNTVLKGFTLTRGTGGSNYGGGAFGGTLNDCVLVYNQAPLGGGAANAVLNGCMVKSNVAGAHGGGVTECTLNNCILLGNTANSTLNGGGGGGASSSTLNNCVLFGNRAPNSSRDTIYSRMNNCIAWGNIGGTNRNGVTTYSCVEGGTAGVGNISGDPLFVDAGIGDFRLKDGSPCVDSGSNGLVQSTTDMAGNPRIQNGTVDMGAFEGGKASCTVEFRLDECLIHLGGGNLQQTIARGEDALEPVVAAVAGWTFDGWSAPFRCVTNALTVESRTSAAPSDWTVIIHRGPLTNDATWASGVVHVVVGTVTVANGVTLIIEPGSVVKLCPGAVLSTTSGMIMANGATFTHLYDDEVGGDTLNDGGTRIPVAGQYSLIQVFTDAATVFRYHAPSEVGGELIEGGNTNIWRSGSVIVVTQDVTVASGKTLVVEPGAIVKLTTNRSITVNYGGKLIAAGRRTQPIVFTSLKDDEHGGDTNGDGENSAATIGDWGHIVVNGTGTFEHVSVLNGGQYGGEGGMVQINPGGAATFTNCVIAHARFDAFYSCGSVRMDNSVIWDADRGFNNRTGGSGTYRNCVVYNTRMGLACDGGNVQLSNCSITRYLAGMGYWRGSMNFNHCNFWTDLPNAYSPASALSANPLYVDADQGDFRLQAGSPLIDAGDAAGAPALDYFGQLRYDVPDVANTGVAGTNGVCPDIGIHEVVPRYAGADVDAVPTEISMPASAQVVDDLMVVWRVANRGTANFTGSWRDELFLVAENGRETALGTVNFRGGISPGSSKLCNGTFQLPAVAEGNWRVKVLVNAGRDVLEGTCFSNNVCISTQALAIQVPAISLATAQTVTVAGAGSALVRLTDLPADGGLLRLTGSTTGWTALAVAGGVPTAEYSWVSQALSGGGFVLSVPTNAGGSRVYLMLENPGGEAVNVECAMEAKVLQIWSASRTQLTATATASLEIRGAGLASVVRVSLAQGGTPVAATTNLVAGGDMALAATFDLTGVAPGAYELSVETEGGSTVALPASIQVVAPQVGPQLNAWLELPSAVRDRRVCVGWIRYQNRGDADMPAPVFILKPIENTTKLSMSESGPFTNEPCYTVGASPAAPLGILKAGEENRIPFYFTLQGSYSIRLMRVLNTDDTFPAEYVERWQEMQDELARLAAARAEQEFFEANGVAVSNETVEVVSASGCSVSGWLLEESTDAPLAGVEVVLRTAEGVDAGVSTTAEDGAFAFGGLPGRGSFYVTATGVELPEDANVEIVDGASVTNWIVRAVSHCGIEGTVTGDGVPLAGAEVYIAGPGGRTQAITDEAGAYRTDGLDEGIYVVSALAKDGFAGGSRTNIVLAATQRWATVDFDLQPAAQWVGVLTNAETGLAISNAALTAYLASGDLSQVTATSDGAGAFRFPGLAAGDYIVALNGGDWQMPEEMTVSIPASGTVTQNVGAIPAALFDVWPPFGPVPLEVATSLPKEEGLEGIASWSWDFDGDGLEDGTNELETFIYTNAGTYTVTLVATDTNGVARTNRALRAVETYAQATNKLKDNVIVLDGKEYAWIEATTNSLTITQCVETVSQQISTQSVFILQLEAGGTPLLCAATSAEQVEGLWQVGIVPLTDWAQVFESLDVYEGGRRGLSAAGANTLAAAAKGGGSHTWNLTGTSRIGVNAECVPEFVFRYNIVEDGKVQARIAAKLNASIGLNIHIDEKKRMKKKEWETSLTIASVDIPIAGLPVAGLSLRPSVEMNLAAEAEFDGEVKFDYQPVLSYKGQIGAVRHGMGVLAYVDNGWKPLCDNSLVFDKDGATLDFYGDGYIKTTSEIEAKLSVPLNLVVTEVSLVSAEAWAKLATELTVKSDNSEPRMEASYSFDYGAGVNFVDFSDAGWLRWLLNSLELLNEEASVCSLDFKTWSIPDLPTFRWPVSLPTFTVPDWPEMSPAGYGFGQLIGKWPDWSLPEVSGTAVDFGNLNFAGKSLPSFGNLSWSGIALNKINLAGVMLSTFGISKLEPPLGGLDFLPSCAQFPGVDVGQLGLDISALSVAGASISNLPNFNLPDFGAYTNVDWSSLPCIQIPDFATGGMDIQFKVELPNLSVGQFDVPNPVVELFWDWGDGKETTDFQELLSHRYAKPGMYLVTVGARSKHVSQIKKTYQFLVFIASQDFDGDGMVNWWETFYGLDPFNASDAAGDADDDGVSNFLEYISAINPRNEDTDGDGMPDDFEVKYMKTPARRMGLDPHVDDAARDPDGDGLVNMDEYIGGTAPAGGGRRGPSGGGRSTNPIAPDTDEGGVDDMTECLQDTNPLDPSDDKEDEPDSTPEDDGSGHPLQSLDPNEMAGPPGWGNSTTERFVAPGQWMDYTIYFENKATASAAAQEVWVDNPLSEYLDWNTFEMEAVGVQEEYDMGLAGQAGGTSTFSMASMNYDVETVLTVNTNAGMASWYLRVVDTNSPTGWPEDPYDGFLPPNDATHRGEGSLSYRIRVRADAPNGARIDNGATIVFDYNDPIVTDPAWSNVVNDTPQSTLVVLYGLWMHEENGQIEVCWSTASEENSVGFDLYREQDGIWVKVNASLIFARDPMGAMYCVTDAGANAVDSFRYKVVETETDGRTQEYGPFERSAWMPLLENVAAAEGGMEIRWLGRDGEVYEVQKCADLTGGFRTVATGIPPARNNVVRYIDREDGAAGFYRIRVVEPDSK